jgi:hypothetical protein
MPQDDSGILGFEAQLRSGSSVRVGGFQNPGIGDPRAKLKPSFGRVSV